MTKQFYKVRIHWRGMHYAPDTLADGKHEAIRITRANWEFCTVLEVTEVANGYAEPRRAFDGETKQQSVTNNYRTHR